MEFHVRDNEPFIEMESGIPTVTFWFSDKCNIDTLRAFAANMDAGPKEVVLSIGLPVSNLVDFSIDSNRLGFPYHHSPSDPVLISDEQRVLFESIKAALLQAVAKIDSIKWVPESDVALAMKTPEVIRLIGGRDYAA